MGGGVIQAGLSRWTRGLLQWSGFQRDVWTAVTTSLIARASGLHTPRDSPGRCLDPWWIAVDTLWWYLPRVYSRRPPPTTRLITTPARAATNSMIYMTLLSRGTAPRSNPTRWVESRKIVSFVEFMLFWYAKVYRFVNVYLKSTLLLLFAFARQGWCLCRTRVSIIYAHISSPSLQQGKASRILNWFNFELSTIIYAIFTSNH